MREGGNEKGKTGGLEDSNEPCIGYKFVLETITYLIHRYYSIPSIPPLFLCSPNTWSGHTLQVNNCLPDFCALQ